MSKETFYFSHDYNARNDPKLINLIMKAGLDSLGIYWCIIEMLYEQNGYISLSNIECIAYELHTDCERIKNVLQNYGLFKFKDDKCFSESVLRRLKVRKIKSDKARQSAVSRWNKVSLSDANAMRTLSDGNAIKESKVKESKVNKRERIKKEFIPPSLDEVKKYFFDSGYKETIAIKAFNHYSSGDWHDANGNKVINWKQKINTNWFKDENKITFIEPEYEQVWNPETADYVKRLKR